MISRGSRRGGVNGGRRCGINFLRVILELDYFYFIFNLFFNSGAINCGKR